MDLAVFPSKVVILLLLIHCLLFTPIVCVGDKRMPCKPGVAGSIPGFTIKTLSVEHSCVPVIKYTHRP